MGDSSNRPVELVAIINSFNRKALLERALLSLTEALCHAPFGAATVVFEAGSSDGSREFLEEWQRKNPSNSLLVITAPTKRASFSDGVNLGCSTALARFPSCRWLLLYETDNFLAEINPISEAISLLEKEPGLAAAGFTVKRHDGSFAGYGIRFPSWLSLALGQPQAARLNLLQPNDTPWHAIDGVRWRMCDIVFTSPLLIRREAWKKI